METKVTGAALSVQLHYTIEEDLLKVGGEGKSPVLFLNDWSLGSRKDIMAVALKLLSETQDDEVLVIGIVPNVRASEGGTAPEEGYDAMGERDEL